MGLCINGGRLLLKREKDSMTVEKAVLYRCTQCPNKPSLLPITASFSNEPSHLRIQSQVLERVLR